MIKTILVGIDGSEHARTAIRYALWLARAAATAAWSALHVVDIVSIEGSFFHDISGSLGFEPYLDFSSKMRGVLQERGKALLDAFAELAAQRRRARRHRAGHGHRRQRDRRAGAHGRPGRDRPPRRQRALLHRPARRHRRERDAAAARSRCSSRRSSSARCQRPLLAYDGSARAASAMQQAAEFCATLALPLTVLTVNRDEEQGRRILNEASSYLQPYNVTAQFELQQTGNAPERIANFIRERDHDLLFIGAYGHSRIIEMVLGSTTEYVLRNADCPVFLYR